MLNTLSKKIPMCVIWKERHKKYKNMQLRPRKYNLTNEEVRLSKKTMEGLCQQKLKLWIPQPTQEWQ